MNAQHDDIKMVTFGCRLNAYESDVMRGHAREAGLKNTVIVNTCAVTAEAERQARQAIRKLYRENPDAKIIVTGCSAQIKPELYAGMPEVAHVLANDAKMEVGSYHDIRNQKLEVRSQKTENVLTPGFRLPTSGLPRAFLQVQNGCDHRCTFCIIPYGRGPSRSVPVGVVAQNLAALADAGYNEIVLTGVDMTSYGADLPGQPTLGQMLRRVLALVPQVPRIRLSSLDPQEIDDDLWQVIAHEPRLMPHVHLSLQAADDMVLKRMKRRHSVASAAAVIEKARRLRPDMVFGADIIAGFPTENDAMFENTLAFVKDHNITWLHVFPYSAREGTPAAKMPQVPASIRKARAAALHAAGDDAVQKLLQKNRGTVQRVLIEQNKTGTALGRTPHYAQVFFETHLKAGSVVDVMCTHVEGDKLYGALAQAQKAA